MAQHAPPPDSPPAPDGIVDATPLIEYPTVYTFKVMGKQAPDFIEYVRDLFRQLLGTDLPADAIHEQPSSKGKYTSLSVAVNLESEERRRAIYARLHTEPRIVYYL